MSKQESYSVLTAPKLPLSKATPTGTTLTLTVKVQAGDVVEVSDWKPHIKNGDEVIWNFIADGGDYQSSRDTPVISFHGQVLKSEFLGAVGVTKVDHDIAEELQTLPLTEPYSIILRATGKGDRKLKPAAHSALKLLDGSDPTLVIDNIGKPPKPFDPDCDDGSEEGARHPWR